MAHIDPYVMPEFDPIAPEEHRGGRWLTGVGPGLLAGTVMAVILFILAVAGGETAYHPAQVVASVVLGRGAIHGGAGPIVLGLAIHFILSGVLGALFTAIFGRTTMRRMLGFGLFYGIFLWAIAQFLLLPLVSPFAVQLGTVGSFFLAHLAYGLMLAACVPTVKDIDAPVRAYIDPLRREVSP